MLGSKGLIDVITFLATRVIFNARLARDCKNVWVENREILLAGYVANSPTLDTQ